MCDGEATNILKPPDGPPFDQKRRGLPPLPLDFTIPVLDRNVRVVFTPGLTDGAYYYHDQALIAWRLSASLRHELAHAIAAIGKFEFAYEHQVAALATALTQMWQSQNLKKVMDA